MSEKNIRYLHSRYPLVAALVASALIMGAVLALVEQAFVTNDDVSHMLILSGHMTSGSGDVHVTHHNVVGAAALRWLIQQVPSINWYTLHLLIGHFAATVAVLYCVAKRAPSSFAFLVTLASLLPFELYFLSRLQFSHTAGALSAGGFALLLLSGLEAPFSRRLAACGVLLALAGSMVRLPVFVLICTMLAPILILTSYARHRGRPLIAACALLGLVLLTQLVHLGSYGTPEWARYFEWSAPMRVLQNYPMRFDDEALVQRTLTRVGWSEDTWLLFHHAWFFEDPDVYTETAITQIVDDLGFELSWKGVVGTLAYNGRIPMRGLGFIWIVAWLAFLPLVLGTKWKPQYVARLMSIWIPFAVVASVLVWHFKMPDRIAAALLYPVAVVTGLEALSQLARSARESNRASRLCAVAVTLAVCIGGIVSAGLLSAENARRAETHRALKAELFREPDALYALLNFDYLNTFRPWTRLDQLDIQLLPAAEYWRSPLVQERLSRDLGYPTFVEALGRADRLRIVGRPLFVAALRSHVLREHNIRLKMVTVGEFDGIVCVKVERDTDAS